MFEAGMGASRSSWGAVVPEVARHTTAVAYDRSGLGLSPPDPRPRTLDRMATDLLDLLAALGEGPFVLVAQSWGGPIVRVAAGRAPERIAGLVLVDVSDERCDLYFSRAAEIQTDLFVRTLPLLAWIGGLRLASRSAGRALPVDAAARVRIEEGSVAHGRAYRAELAPSIDELRALLADPPEVPEIPVTLISGTKASRVGRKRRDALIATHRARAEASPAGRHVTATRSGHLVPLTEPQLVAGEIVRVVDLVRASGRS